MGKLDDYRRKRDFSRTPEPDGGPQAGEEGTAAAAGGGRSFVVQKHAARALHYDFRLELDGTLKSWAVPKGPSLDPATKRLAVEVEDHPLSYAGFEGAIPQGQYGGGTVIVWDRGSWKPKGDPRDGLARGKLEFDLAGEKLAGRWLLVRTGGGRGTRSGGASGGKPQWLLRKLDDERARPGEGDDVVDERPESVLSGRTVEEVAARPGRVWQSGSRRWLAVAAARLDGAREAPLPEFVRPQLASAAEQPPAGDGWLHEIKLDGYRLLCRLEGGRAKLITRSGKDWTDRFPRLAAEAPFLAAEEALLDGEVVWLRPDGKSDFQALQAGLDGAGDEAPIYYLLFDLLHVDGHDLRAVPLAERKRLLRRLLDPPPAEVGRLRYGDHHRGGGRRLFDEACALGLEGTIAKRADAAYRSGRGGDWLKVKCGGRQELVVVGYTESETRAPFRSLLVAYHGEEGLTYAGKVGTGFDARTKRRLIDRLRPLERPDSPLDADAAKVGEPRAHWLEPVLVAEVAFTEWTRDGVLRHPSFVALRDDKEASEVVRGAPRRPAPAQGVKTTATATKGMKKTTTTTRKGARTPTDRGERAMKITHPERVLFPDAGFTKGDLADYYRTVADVLVPEIAGRPLSLLRCPEGIGGECFYQKHLGPGAPAALRQVEVEEASGERALYPVADTPEALVALAQIGALEIHPWGSRVGHLDRPDRLIFDLDPGPGLGWGDVVAAARELRDLLSGLGLDSLPRLTGGKGVHLMVPVEPELAWPQAKELTRAIARLLAQRGADRYTVNPRKDERQGKIFVDYLRNGFGATAIASYSPRARPGGPVAVPIRWDELTPRREPSSYNLRNVPRRLAALAADPWGDAAARGQRLRPEIRRQLGLGD